MADKQANKQQEREWRDVRLTYRREVTRVLAETHDGQVDLTDLDKLHTFCMCAMALQNKVTQRVWEVARQETGITSFSHEESMNYRSEATQTINQVGSGVVNGSDLDRLESFCRIALRLQGKVTRFVWEAAKREAEIASYLHEEETAKQQEIYR